MHVRRNSFETKSYNMRTANNYIDNYIRNNRKSLKREECDLKYSKQCNQCLLLTTSGKLRQRCICFHFLVNDILPTKSLSE